MITLEQVKKLAQEHRQKEQEIWDDLEFDIYQKYRKQGYYSFWATEKAHRDVLCLRSQPKNPTTTRIPPEQTLQGDLD